VELPEVSSQVHIEEQISRAVQVLKEGGIIAYPTDTVYGLGADASNEHAVARIFEAKRRSRDLALPLLISDISELAEVAGHVPEIARTLADRFLPGGLTLVLKRSSRVLDCVTGGGDTIAVRIPDHPVPVAVIRGLGAPLVGTSANLAGMPAPGTAAEVRSQVGDEIDFIVEGTCPGGVESTVVDVSGDAPVLVREGAIPWSEIADCCGLAPR
jgi:L-threonylcarbamoyladenylate synthase